MTTSCNNFTININYKRDIQILKFRKKKDFPNKPVLVKKDRAMIASATLYGNRIIKMLIK